MPLDSIYRERYTLFFMGTPAEASIRVHALFFKQRFAAGNTFIDYRKEVFT